jgi:hypothetical protein
MINLLDIVKNVYHKTPGSLQFIYWPLKFIDKHINKLRYEVWILKGEEILSKQQLGIIYAFTGGSRENMDFLINLAFGNSCKEHCLGKSWLWNIYRTKKKGQDCSLMVLEASQSLRRLLGMNCVYIPGWIFGQVDIADDSLLFKKKSLKSDLSKIRKNNLRFEVRNEMDQFDNFYHNMYVPYIRKSHDKRAIIHDYDFFLKEFTKCDLVLIKKEQTDIAGCLLYYNEKAPRLLSLGVKDANTAYVDDGAIGALYYFSVKYLKEQGHKKINFGLSRPFLGDGVLRYKKKWGLEIDSADKIGFLIEPIAETTAIKGFLFNNPFVFVEKKEFHGAVFRLNIYFDGVVNHDLSDAVPAELRDTIKIYSAGNFFKNKREVIQ